MKAETAAIPPTAPKPRRRASRSVYVFDRLANVVIRVGGLGVVVSVIGLVAFVFSQVLPLFAPSGYGELEAISHELPGRTLYIGADEYRRVAVRLSDNGTADIFSLLTGETLVQGPITDFVATDADHVRAALDGRSVTAASVTLRAYATAYFENMADVPMYGVVLGLDNGAVVAGTLAYVTDYRRFELGQVPAELSGLSAPAAEEFKSPRYAPKVVIAQHRDRAWVVEHMPDFGFFRYVRAVLVLNRVVDLPSEGEAIESLHLAVEHGDPERDLEALTGAITSTGRALLCHETLSVNMMTEQLEAETLWAGDVSKYVDGRPTLLQVHELRRQAVFATPAGVIHVLRQGEDGSFGPAYPGINVFAMDPVRGDWREIALRLRDDDVAPSGPLRLTAMSYLLGDTTLLLGDNVGGIQAWFPVRDTPEDINPRLRRIRSHASGSGAIAGFCSAQASKAFAVWDETGRVRCIHNTSERQFFDQIAPGGAPQGVYFGSKADGVLCIDGTGQFKQWWMEPRHVEVSFKSLFGTVFYEGYNQPEYQWQSHAGTDDVEEKYSLMPLILGSIKGGMYALLFALPLAVLGAVYTSEFMAPKLRGVIKPSMEVMASLPSVVLGFLGALYFAPEAAPRMPTLIVFAMMAPVLFVLFGWVFGQLPPYVTRRFGPLTTTATLAAILAVAWVCAGILGPRLETRIFPATEGANPAILDMRTFAPLSEADARATSAGDFRSWTDGGRELPRPLAAAQGEPPAAIWDGGRAELAPGAKLRLRDAVTALAWGETRRDLPAGTELSVDGGILRLREANTSLPLRLPPETTYEWGGREVRVAGGDFRVYPQGWWVPGGHSLFSTLMILPLALLAGMLIKLLIAFLFGGNAMLRTFPGRLNTGNPVMALRNAIAGNRPGMRPVAADITIALGAAGLCLLLGLGLSALISPGLESLLFRYDHPTAGAVADFRRWVTGPTGWTFTQTNSLIVGFAMGFAVIPIIYSISEDALSSVPNQLRAASLACGASRWQTTIRVVVPAAASGIFSAIVIGLGRALGETMIVVMAAGGTPLMEMQPLSGFRSLSAAIATEMPEAPVGSTHYRTLFLGGLLLFLMTFVISTMAELVRMRLRRKLSRL